MKKVILFLSISVFLAFFVFAQDKKFTPLLGSTLDIAKSTFCKKYQCVAQYDNQKKIFTHFILNMPDDDPIFFERLGRTELFVSEDKKKQLVSISVYLRQNFKSNYSAKDDENIMLADLIYSAVGKKLKLDKYKGNSPEINECFFRAGAAPKENIEHLTRVLTTGDVTLQTEKKKVKYQAVCSRRFNGSTPEMYTPAFWISIPSIKDSQTPVYRYR
jgi:hypothetical protein